MKNERDTHGMRTEARGHARRRLGLALLLLAACSSNGGSDGAGGASSSPGAGGGQGGTVGQGGSAQGGAGNGGSGQGGNVGGGGAQGGSAGQGGAAGGSGGAAGNSGAGGSGPSAGGGGNVGDASAGAGTGGAREAGVDARGSGGAAGAALDASNGTGGGGPQTPLPAGVVSVFPAPGGTGLCADPPLRITFTGPPTLGSAGKIQVFRTAQPGTAVAVVDMAVATVTDTMGGTTFNMARPVYVDGNSAVIYLRSHSLAYGQSYYVTVDSGAIVAPGARAVSITDATTWRFTTAAAAPANLSSLTVALDGSGQFCSVQGATDALPANNSVPSTITIAAGTYHEIIHFRAKNSITLHGADRKGTIIAGTNNDLMNPGTATRSLVGIDASTDLIVENLTIHNLTPQGGSQAEALRLQGCDRCVVRNADILSLQDTLLWAGRVYADNCLIAGNVDFVWGGGTAYFNNCEIRTSVRNGANVMARNPATTYGYVFVDSRLTADAGVTGQTLARIDSTVYPASHVAYINCTMGSHIAPVGWQLTAGTPTAALRFWEFQSVDPSGNPINVSQRLPGLVPITPAQAVMMRDPSVVLAGWQPPTN